MNTLNFRVGVVAVVLNILFWMDSPGYDLRWSFLVIGFAGLINVAIGILHHYAHKDPTK